MIRVVHIRSSAGFYGAERVIVNLLKSFPGHDVQALMVSIENYRSGNVDFANVARAEGVRVLELSCSGKWRSGSQKELNRHVKEFQADCIHTHDYRSHLFGYVSALKHGIPLVATLHGWTRETARLRLYELMESLVLRRFDAVTVVSSNMAAQLLKRGLACSKVVTIANSVDTEQFRPGDGSWCRQRFSLGADDYVFGTVGRLSEEKGQDLLLRAFAEVRRSCPGTRLLLVGDGPQEEALRQLAADLGLGEAVLFAGVQAEIEKILPGIDCYVSPSRTEGMPMIVLEAMACGRPIIATEVGAVGELLDEGAGFLTESGDAEGMASLMIAAANGGLSTDAAAEAARQRSIERYGLEAQGRAYAAVYAAVLGSGELGVRANV